MAALRPLPPKPSLDLEHEEANALLGRLRAGDPDALVRARAWHPSIDASAAAQVRLDDAQRVIAREYGFTGWPRLVRYFSDVQRQQLGNPSFQAGARDYYDWCVRVCLVEHRERGASVWRALAAYVPRFYGLRADDIFAATITEDDARLVVARGSGFPSWEMLLECIESQERRPRRRGEVDPLRAAGNAMAAADLGELRRVVEAHPDLLDSSDYDASRGHKLFDMAIHQERAQGIAAMRPIMDWLATQGLDLQRELNIRLCGRMCMDTETVRWLLGRGADATWSAPNGIPVLEHALIRYWNAEGVDLVAAGVVPREALWIAAGLGDMDAVRRSLDARGKPTSAARRRRPDFDAIGPLRIPSHPDPDDDDVLAEAFLVAMLNGRAKVLEYMVSRGFAVDSLVWGSPVLHMAIQYGMTGMVECLVRCGANPDFRDRPSRSSAREIARRMFENAPQDADHRRIVELCGMDPDSILAERDARSADSPRLSPRLRDALDLAGDDALRLGYFDIGPENLLFGLLRGGDLPLMFFTKASRMDLDRFRADARDRMRAIHDRVDLPWLPLRPDAQATIQAAIAVARERGHETVDRLHLLYALTRAEDGPVADLLARYGSSAAIVNAKLQDAL